jgi:DNA (cytosine-5)-methyltransferase 1
MVWENVPGAFSSNFKDGFGDFGAVLEEAVRIAEPGFSLPRLPDKQRWTKSGGIVGDGWSVAWRTHDAQYWGVPQRRRRISMVVDFNGYTAGDILFERFGGAESSGVHEVVPDSGRESRAEVQPYGESVCGDTPESRAAWKTAAGDAESGSSCAGRNPIVMATQQGGAEIRTDNRCPTLTASAGMSGNNQPVICSQGNGIDRADTAGCNGRGWKEDISYTLNTIDRPAVMAFDTTQICSRGNGSIPAYGRPCHTLNANAHVPCVALDMTHACDVIWDCGGISPSLQARMGTGGNQVPCTFSMQGFGDYKESEIVSSCKQRDSKDATDLVISIDDEKNAYIDQFGTLKAHASGGTQQHVMERMVVRRLTPLECTRLQGYPDGWVDIGGWTDEKGRVHKEADAPKYKALGNSIALPFWRWMFGRMAAYLPEGATLGSLFDGIGGFPLCWESIHGKGTAVWASEIEPFAIAVTKHHFGGNSDVG